MDLFVTASLNHSVAFFVDNVLVQFSGNIASVFPVPQGSLVDVYYVLIRAIDHGNKGR